MAKRDYNKMYAPTPEEKEIVETVADVVDTASEHDVVEELKKEEKKKSNTGKVIGGASLNVRFAPAGKIDSTVAEGTVVTIEEDLGEWYKISAPKSGYVMKKFIEV